MPNETHDRIDANRGGSTILEWGPVDGVISNGGPIPGTF